MAGRLTPDEIARADALLDAAPATLDLGFPTMKREDAILCVRRLLGMSERDAVQLVAASRGLPFKDEATVEASDAR